MMPLLIVVLLALFSPFAYAQTFTPNLNLCKPSDNQSNWGPCLRGDFDKLDFLFQAPLIRNGTTISCPTCGPGGGVLAEADGGTGQSTYTLGDLLYSDAADSLAKLPGNTTGAKFFLTQTGTGSVSAAPVWTTIGAADVPSLDASKVTSGVFSVARGGLGLDTFVIGDVIYASAANTLAVLPGNTTTGKLFLAQTGDGVDSAAPEWSTVALGDLGGTVEENQGGTGIVTYTIGDLLYADAADSLAKLAGNVTTTKKFLNQTGDGVDSDAPSWDALIAADVPSLDTAKITTGTFGEVRGGTDQSAYALGDILASDATNNLARLAGHVNADRRFLVQEGTGAVSAMPAWSLLTDADIPNTITLTNLTQIATRDVADLQGTTLPAGVINSSLQSVGALGTGSISAGFGNIDNGGDNVTSGTFRSTVDARTVADDGAGTNATLTLEPISTYVRITCNDANGCDVTMSEASAADGDILVVTCLGAVATNFADTAGVSELAGAFACSLYDSISMIYASDRWIERARSNN